MFWCVWMTSVERLDNDADDLFDYEIITLRNVWQIKSVKMLEIYREELLDYG